MPNDLHHHEDKIRELMYNIATKHYGLKQDEFVVRLWAGRGWNVQRGRSITRVYLGSTDLLENLDSVVKGSLAAVAHIKRTKGTFVEVFSGLRVPPKDVPAAYRQLYGLPALLDREECDIRIEFKITLTHKETGVTITKHADASKNWQKLPKIIDAGREELTERVADAVKKLQELKQGAVK